MSDTNFEVTKDEVDGGYLASGIGYGIPMLGESMEGIRQSVREAVDCYVNETMEPPGIICFCRGSQLTKPTEQLGAQGSLHPGRQTHG